MTTDLSALAAVRRYRELAMILLDLERERGVFDLAALADDPELALQDNIELAIEFDTAPKSGCSVFGYYRYKAGGPSLIVVHPSMTSARDRFTMLHEFGHHIQRQHLDWATYRYSVGGAAGERLEERVADAIAAEILLPADFTSTSLDAKMLSDLHARTRASRSAVAMRAIEVAPESESLVVLVLESDGTVIFARAAGDDLFAPARGVPQADLASLMNQASLAGGHVAKPLSEGLRAASGWVQGDIEADVALDHSGLYAFAVLRPSQKFGRTPTWSIAETECSNSACELVFSVDGSIEMCTKCSGPKCPNCSTCYCEQRIGDTCLECFTALSLAEQSGQIQHECM